MDRDTEGESCLGGLIGRHRVGQAFYVLCRAWLIERARTKRLRAELGRVRSAHLCEGHCNSCAATGEGPRVWMELYPEKKAQGFSPESWCSFDGEFCVMHDSEEEAREAAFGGGS